jgi:hypothetical protein
MHPMQTEHTCGIGWLGCDWLLWRVGWVLPRAWMIGLCKPGYSCGGGRWFVLAMTISSWWELLLFFLFLHPP